MSAVLQPGLQKLVMDELTMAMDTGSVRARGSGTATATLLGVATRIENFVDAPVDGLRDLETRAQTLSDAIADLDAHANAIQKEAASVETLMGQGASFARGINKGQRTPANQLATLATLRERLMVLQGDGLVAARERRDKARELDKIKRDMDQVVAAQPRRRYAAEIDVDVKEAGELVIELTYNVYGASWHPLYDLRSSETGLEVRYLAEVQQNTGEDWVDVALTLSTAQPNASLVVPELDPWYVIPKPPMPPPMPRAMHARPADATMMMAAPAAPISMAGGPFAKLNEMTVNEAAVSASGAALNFDLPARASIPGNGDPRKVTVAVLALKPRMDYISAPKVDATVYQIGRAHV